jgi:hypothetical protein
VERFRYSYSSYYSKATYLDGEWLFYYGILVAMIKVWIWYKVLLVKEAERKFLELQLKIGIRRFFS